MSPDASRRIVGEYLEAFAARDLARCVALFDPNAVVEFLMSSCTGLDEIAGWHADRFAANLRVLRVERVDGGTPITIQAARAEAVPDAEHIEPHWFTPVFVNANEDGRTYRSDHRAPVTGWRYRGGDARGARAADAAWTTDVSASMTGGG